MTFAKSEKIEAVRFALGSVIDVKKRRKRGRSQRIN